MNLGPCKVTDHMFGWAIWLEHRPRLWSAVLWLETGGNVAQGREKNRLHCIVWKLSSLDTIINLGVSLGGSFERLNDIVHV